MEDCRQSHLRLPDPGSCMPAFLSTLRLPVVFALILCLCSAGAVRADAPVWPFVPLVRPAVPENRVKGGETNWCRNPIDSFVLARLKRAGLQPNPSADRLTLLRRVT